jgi:hypothetical protein
MRDWINVSSRGFRAFAFSRGRTVTREAVVQTPLRLDLRTANGRVTVRGIEGSSARVRAEIDLKGFHPDDGGPAEAMVAEGIVFEAGALRIESPAAARDSLSVHYEVSVPIATLASLAVLNGPVDVTGIEGPLHVRLTNGPLGIEDIAGPIEVELTNGPAHIEHCRGALEAKVSNGPLHVEAVEGGLDLRVNNGPISIEDAASDIRASAHNGPVAYEGAVRGNIEMSSTRGGIVLELPGDSRFELDAEAERGGVYCDFDVKDEGGAPSDEPAPRIVLRAERGEIVVRQTSRAAVL